MVSQLAGRQEEWKQEMRQRVADEVIARLETQFGPLDEPARAAIVAFVEQVPETETVDSIAAAFASQLGEAGVTTVNDDAFSDAMNAILAGRDAPAPGTPEEGLRELPDAWESMSDSEKMRYTALELLAEGLRDPMTADFSQVGQLLGLSRDLDLLNEGTVRLDDGTVITSDMLNHEDPVVAQQFRDAYQQRRQQVEQQAIDTFNAYQIDQHTLDVGAYNRETDRVMGNFEAANTEFMNRLTLGQAEVNRVATEYDQLIRGLGESRARSENELNTIMSLLPYATGGQTQFTANDLGATHAHIAQLAGIDPNANVIQYPGSITIDPRATQGQYDQSLGVDRQLGPLPGLGVGMGDVPVAPVIAPGPGSIQLRPPASIAPPPVGAGGPMPNPTIQINDQIRAMLAAALAGGA